MEAVIERISTDGLAPFAKDFITNSFGDDYNQNHKEEFEKRIEKSLAFSPVGERAHCLQCLVEMIQPNIYVKLKFQHLLFAARMNHQHHWL